jgi:hypothetical protein
MTNLLLAIAGLSLGALIGFGFGTLQRFALAKNTSRQEKGTLKSGWTLMPGAGGRIAAFMIVLVLVQVVCPLLFENANTPWIISAGVVIGYGWTLVQKMRQGTTLLA